MSPIRRWLVASAAVFAVAELIDGIVYRIPSGIVFAVIVGICALWASRSVGWAAPAALLVMATSELLLVIFVYGRGEDPAAWWRLILYGVLSFGVAAIAAVDLLSAVSSRRQHSLKAPGQGS